MKRPGRLLASCLALCLWGSGAWAEDSEPPRRKLVVRVVEVAGGRAYLSPGTEQHVAVGDVVVVGRRRFEVVAVNREHLVVELGEQTLSRGQKGSVRVRQVERARFATRVTPRPVSAFAGRWPEVQEPAAAQTPEYVPLGVMRDARRNRALLSIDHFRILPLSGSAETIGRTRLRLRLHAELEHPELSFDADGFAEAWQAPDLDRRRGNASRPLIRLRQLELGYRGERLFGGVGRLRYASSDVGMLDGARVTGRLGRGVELSAFGGAVPAPLDQGWSTAASRFGTQLTWLDGEGLSGSFARLGFSGSSYGGSLDERRLTGAFEAYPGLARIAGRAQISLFDEDNPFRASTTELTVVGGDAGLTLGSLRLSASAEMRRPDRSRYLMDLLPPGYFCVAQAAAGFSTDEPCVGGDRRHSASLGAAFTRDEWSVSAGVVGVSTRRARAEQLTARLSARHQHLIGPLWADVGLSASSGSMLDFAGASLGLGRPLLADRLDVSLSYGPRISRYRADSDAFVEHDLGARVWSSLGRDVDVGISADALLGRDVDVAYFQASLAWRPRF